jgi:hypothetical protein
MRGIYKDQNDINIPSNKIFLELVKILQLDDSILIPSLVTKKYYKESEFRTFAFRGDCRHYEEVFANGLHPRYRYKKEVDDNEIPCVGVYISQPTTIAFTRNFNVAPYFPFNDNEYNYVYMVYLETAFDVTAHGDLVHSKNKARKEMYSWADEVCTLNEIPSKDIVAAFPIKRLQSNNYITFRNWKTFAIKGLIRNPDTDPNLIELAHAEIKKLLDKKLNTEQTIPTTTTLSHVFLSVT